MPRSVESVSIKCNQNVYKVSIRSPIFPLALTPSPFPCRTWDVYNGKGALDTLQHTHDVLALALRPDGKQLAVSTLDGTLTLWDPQEGQMQVWMCMGCMEQYWAGMQVGTAGGLNLSPTPPVPFTPPRT